MTRLGELPAPRAPQKAPAHYARPLGDGSVLVTDDAASWIALSPEEYEAFAAGEADPALATRLAEAGFSLSPAVDAAAEGLFPGSALSWRGPARLVLFLERDGRVMAPDVVERALQLAFSCGPDVPRLELVADDARRCWPSLWLAVQLALRRGEWTRRPPRLELRARRLPDGPAAEELRAWGVLRRLWLDADGPPPSEPAEGDALLADVRPRASDPAGWIDWMRERGLRSYRLRIPAGASLKDGRAFARFHARALERLLEGCDRSDLVDEALAERLRGRPLALAGLDVLGELAIDADGGLYTSETAATTDAGRAVLRLGDVFSILFGDLPQLAAVRAAAAALDADRQPLCSRCAYRPFCRTSPARHLAAQGTVWGRLPESAQCAAAADFLDSVFALRNREKFNILLKKSNIDTL